MTAKTKGETFAVEYCKRVQLRREMAEAIDAEIKAAERRGFEFAIMGGHELAATMVKDNAHPLVLYLSDDEAVQELMGIFKAAVPGLTGVAAPKAGRA